MLPPGRVRLRFLLSTDQFKTPEASPPHLLTFFRSRIGVLSGICNVLVQNPASGLSGFEIYSRTLHTFESVRNHRSWVILKPGLTLEYSNSRLFMYWTSSFMDLHLYAVVWWWSSTYRVSSTESTPGRRRKNLRWRGFWCVKLVARKQSPSPTRPPSSDRLIDWLIISLDTRSPF